MVLSRFQKGFLSARATCVPLADLILALEVA